MTNVEPKYQKLIYLLQGRLFRIPNYQRSYSWENRQRNDLFDDIDKISNSNKDHFMATVVCLMRKNEVEKVGAKELYVYDIVDGQQRLTTLVALLKALCIEMKKGTTDEKDEAKDLDKLLVKGDKRLILLQTNHNEAHIFTEYLVEGKIPDKVNIQTLAEKNLYELFISCHRFINEWKVKHKRSLIDLLSIVQNRLGCIFYELEDESIVYTVFEVLNSRGLEVNWLDKCKSVLMGIVYDKFQNHDAAKEYIQHLQSYWADIYRILGIKELNGDEILTFAATLLLPGDREKGKLLNTEDSLDLFKELSYEDHDNILNIAKTLLVVAQKLKNLSDILNFKFHNSISQSRYLYVSISSNTLLSDDEKNEILSRWENVTFRIYGMMGRDSKKKVGDYIRFGREVFNNSILNPFKEKELPHDYKQFEAYCLKDKIIIRINEIGKDAPVELAVEELRETDCYTYWGDELRYFFFKYEKYIDDKRNAQFNLAPWKEIFQSSLVKSIEHIFPQNDPHNKWIGLMGSGKDEIENNVHRLGNLLILIPELNSRCGSKNFEEKKKVYKDALLHTANDVIYENYILSGDKKERPMWNKAKIVERENQLIGAAKEIWG